MHDNHITPQLCVYVASTDVINARGLRPKKYMAAIIRVVSKY
jgi:hypothetical protein